MGFDNECILSIQSLPGEYFCPVCRTLVYPNEALQTLCTHLYCKPCLAYVVATTHACPYDGYLVTEADAKPLSESNKSVAEAIDKIPVHCLYQRSGCQWQGLLSECTTHCTGCSYGNSPVVCNRCGTQIIHRQVQEHGQTCPGVQPQAQQVDVGQSQAPMDQNQAVAQAALPASQGSSSQPAVVTTAGVSAAVSALAVFSATASAAAPGAAIVSPAASGQDQSQGNAIAQPQGVVQAATPEQYYQQQQLQYQQYYQQYPGYDPCQQHYQQYGHYQPQAHPQYPHSQHVIQGQQYPQPYVQQPQLQPHLHPQTQAHPQPQPQQQVQAPSQPQPQPQPHSQMQAPVNPQQFHAPAQPPHPQMQPQTHPLPHAPVLGQPSLQPNNPQGQPHPQAQVPQLQPPPHVQHQQPIPSQQHPHLQMQHLQVQPHPHANPQAQLQQQHPHMQPQSHPQLLPQAQPQPQHPSAHAVTGHQSYPQLQPHQQMPPGAPQQRPMHVHPHQQGVPHQLPPHPVQMQSQFPLHQPPQMCPPHSHMPVQVQQQTAIVPSQGPYPNVPSAQQQAHHLVHQPGQQIHHNPSMQPAPQHQGLPQQQAHGHLHPNQQQQQGPFVPQHPMHPQKSLRPQGPPLMQQQLSSQSQLQQNTPLVQGMQTHQTQIAASRPMLPNRSVSQQPFQQSPGHPAKLLQYIASQPLPNQSYLVRSDIRSQVSSEQQLGSVQQSQLARAGSQGALPTALPATSKPTLIGKQGDSVSDKIGQAAELEEEVAPRNAEVVEAIEGSESAELNISKYGGDFKSEGYEEKAVGENERKNIQSDVDDKDSLASAKLLEEGPKSHPNDADSEEPEVKIVKEEAPGKLSEHSPRGAFAGIPTEGKEDQQDKKSSQESKETKAQEDDKKSIRAQIEGKDSAKMQMPHPLPDATVALQSSGTVPERPIQNVISQGLMHENDKGNTLGPPQQQPPHQNVASAHERVFPQPGFHDRNFPQVPHQGPVSGEPRGLPPVQMQSKVMVHPAPISDHERYPQQLLPYGPPQHMQDITHQRPQNMPHLGPNRERISHEPTLHQMQVHAQPVAPTQMRPLMHSFPENLPLQGQPSVVPPMMKQPPGSFHPEGPPGGFPGPGLSTSLARGPSHFGPPQRNFESQAMAPHAYQGQIPPSHAGGSRISQVEPLPGPPSASITERGPHGAEGHMGWPRPPNPMEVEIFANKMPGFYDGGKPEHRQPVRTEHVSLGQLSGVHSNMRKMNGVPGEGPIGAMPDSAFPHGSADARFRPLPEQMYKLMPEEGFRSPAEEHFKPFALDPSGRRIADLREFEDLKQFPRPSNLNGDGVPKFENYSSSSRPLDRGSHAFGPDAASRSFDRSPHGFGCDGGSISNGDASAFPLRLLPPYQSGGSFPVSSGGGSSLHSVDIGGRQKLHDDKFGRKMDSDAAHPDFNRPGSDFGRHPLDSLPLRSPGREYAGLPPSRFGSICHGLGNQPCFEDFNGREPRVFGERSKLNLPSDAESRISTLPPASASGMLGLHYRRGEPDGPGNLQMGEQLGTGNLPGHLRSGDLNGPDVLHSHLRGVDSLGPGLRSSDSLGPCNLPSHLRVGEPLGGEGQHIGEPTALGSFHNHIRMGESAGLGILPSHLHIRGSIVGGSLPSHTRIGEPGFGGSFSMHSFPNEPGLYNPDSFDNPRKRKPGSMGWCRICKIDCETVEGLDLHSQTKEHQKMAMDIVFSIKQDSAKKQKSSSEDHASLDESKKVKKGEF